MCIETYIYLYGIYIYSLVHPQQEVVQTRSGPREVFPQLPDCLVDVDTAHILRSSSAGHPTTQGSEQVKVVIIIGRHCSGGVVVLVVIVVGVCVEVVLGEVGVGLFIVGRIT